MLFSNRNSTPFAFVVFLAIGPHAIHPCFTSNTSTFEEHPKKSALPPWLNDKPHSFQRMWCRNNARYIKISCICMNICLYIHIWTLPTGFVAEKPWQVLIPLRTHWKAREPWVKVDGWQSMLPMWRSTVGPFDQNTSFFHLGNWTHKISGNHLRGFFC